MFVVNNQTKKRGYVHSFSNHAITYVSTGNISAPIRNLTTPQIVKITCSYFLGFKRNLS